MIRITGRISPRAHPTNPIFRHLQPYYAYEFANAKANITGRVAAFFTESSSKGIKRLPTTTTFPRNEFIFHLHNRSNTP